MIKCLECGLCWIPLGGPGDQQIPDCPVCTLRERLVAAEARAEQKQSELNVMSDKWLAAERERDMWKRDADRVRAREEENLKIGLRDVLAERAARVQAEAELSRARELLDRAATVLGERMLAADLVRGILDFLDPANTVPKEPT